MWLDNASEVDILFYEPYANVIADISKNPNYKPLTIGVFGVWGAGKSTLLKLIEQKIDEDSEGKGKTLCININAWTFEGYEDAKIALMEALLREIKEHKDIPSRVKNGVSKLLKKLDFFKLATKAVSVGAPMIASVATGNPIPLLLSVSGKAEDVGNGIKSVADAMQSIRDDYLKDEESDDANSIVNNVRKFRKEFKEALRDDGVENVIVLIDDLDRCCSTAIARTAFCRKRSSVQEITTCSSLTAVPNGSIFSPMIIPGISNQFCLKVSSGAYSALPSLTAAPNWYWHGCWRRTPMCRTGFALLRRNSISPTITGITMSQISLWRPTIRFILWR